MGVKLPHEARFKTDIRCPKCKAMMERTVTQRLVCPNCEFHQLVGEALNRGTRYWHQQKHNTGLDTARIFK